MANLPKYNVIMDTDSYKLSHYLQYPGRKGFVSSYIESRGGKYDEIMVAGMQVWIKNLEANPITMEMIDEAESYIVPHGLPFNREDWEIIATELNGKLPIRIQSAREGTLVPTHNVIAQLINTDERFPWLTSYLETAALRAVWYPTTVATVSFNSLAVIRAWHEKTCDNMDAIPFSLHDFGSRGVSSRESAGLGGGSHMFNSMGTDTLAALEWARMYYGSDVAGFSVPASEHSTATSWGPEREKEYAQNMLNAYDGGIVSVVSDSYNVFEFVNDIVTGSLLDEIKASGKKFVIRPDSGEPVVVLKQLFDILFENLREDITFNEKGYMILPEYIGMIQGDGVNNESIGQILEMMAAEGWAASNIVFGMGGKLLQSVDRDTQKFAMKASSVDFGDGFYDVWKDPISDRGKRSKKGRLALVKTPQGFETQKENLNDYTSLTNKLENVFVNGEVVKEYTLDEIRAWVNEQQ